MKAYMFRILGRFEIQKDRNWFRILWTKIFMLRKTIMCSDWNHLMGNNGTPTQVHSTAEYCASVCCRSIHTRLIDPTINDALRIVTGCLRPTPADNLPMLAGIQPAEVRRRGGTLSLGHRAMESGHLFHSVLTRPSDAAARRLKSRHPFVPAAKHQISFSDSNNIRAAHWADHQWNAEWADGPQDSVLYFQTPVHTHPEWPSQEQPGFGSTASTPMSVVSAPACILGYVLLCGLWVWRRTNRPPCRPPLSNPSTPQDYTAWRFWTIRQSNGCWTPAPISRWAISG